MKRALIASLVAASVLMSGCATQTFVLNEGNGGVIAEYEAMDVFFVNGIGQEKLTDAGEICGGSENVHKVEASQQGLDILIGVLTGFVNPRTAKVYCLK